LTAVWIIWELAATEDRVRGLLQSYVFGTYIASVGTIANFLMGRTAAQLAAAEGRSVWETSRYTMSGFNENDLGLMLALSLPMSFYLLASQKGALLKLLYWLQIIASITAILLTGSRGSLLAAAVSLVMLPGMVYRLPRWQRVVSMVVCVAVLACAMYLVPATSWRRLLNIEQEISEGTLTHRTLIWKAGLDAFRDHAFLGVGAGAYAPTVLKAVGVPYVAHNTFLSVLVELGVVGALLLFALLAGLFHCARRMRKRESSLWIAVLLSWAVGVSSLTWEYRKPTWLLFGILAAHVYAYRAQKPLASHGNGPRSVPRWR
jgi:O-antigen ligase